jgi:hypothetical protein
MSRVLLCATDAGGARNLAPLLPVFARRAIEPTVITNRACQHLFAPPAPSIAKRIIADEIDEAALQSLLEKEQPAAAVCGTSRYASPERALIHLAKRRRLHSIVVLDEWYQYRERFEEENSGELFFPAAIAVQDDLAKTEASAEDVPREICHVTGSPALADLTRRAERLTNFPPAPPTFLNGDVKKPVITFLSETHAADYGTSPANPGKMGSFLGYTEITVRAAILDVLKKIRQPVIFIEKLHPAAAENDATWRVSESVAWRRVRQTDLWALLWHSDAVIGMRSMALLEAHILGCKAASFQPGLLGPERCTAVRRGLIPKLEGLDELEAWLRSRLAEKRNHQEPRIIRRYSFAAPEAAERVVDLALNGRGH